MAEAAVEQPSSRFFCHQCSGEIRPVLPGFTCPQCDSGFIEEISPAFEEERRESSTSEPTTEQNPITDALFDIWGRHFLTSLGAISTSSESRPDVSTDSSSSSSGTSDDDAGHSESAPRTSTTTPTPGAARTRSGRDAPRMAQTRLLFGGSDPAGGSVRAGTGDPNPFLQGMIANILQNLTQAGGAGGGGTFVNGGIPISIGGAGGAVGGFPMNMFQIHGNPGDYAWGSGGLDAIISQLLNQLDNTGAPPAPREAINQLPKVKITQQQVDIKLQCSVCMEDYKIDETVHKLPCDHLFHENCIVPWLELHDTCPVCRKALNEESNQNDGNNDDEGNGQGGGGGGGGSRPTSAGLDRLLRGNGGNINIIFSPRGRGGGGSGGSDAENPLNTDGRPSDVFSLEVADQKLKELIRGGGTAAGWVLAAADCIPTVLYDGIATRPREMSEKVSTENNLVFMNEGCELLTTNMTCNHRAVM